MRLVRPAKAKDDVVSLAPLIDFRGSGMKFFATGIGGMWEKGVGDENGVIIDSCFGTHGGAIPPDRIPKGPPGIMVLGSPVLHRNDGYAVKWEEK